MPISGFHAAQFAGQDGVELARQRKPKRAGVRVGFSNQSQRGVALVMTLIMLSVITFLTIAFLSISRRDRASVTTSQSQTDSHLMADTALARFQSEVTARMMAQNSLQVYDLMLTRNYFNPAGYVNRGNFIDTNNVNYDYRDDGQPLNNTDLLHNIANLFYDPRPPVFVRTNENRSLPLDFRFYLDYNRNRRFETNGLQPVVIDESGTTNGVANFLGEPEWIGVLQNPEYPHSPTNRFIGRYLYLALPISRTLDLNYIHNDSKGLLDGNNTVSSGAGDGFIRNQGVGSWEINLGAFLEDLNTNMYGFNSTVAYQYFPDATRNRGDSYNDAVSFLGYRYRNDLSTLSSVANLFPGNGTTAFSGANAFRRDLIDGYSTRPIINTPFVNLIDPDAAPRNLTGEPWSGSKNARQFFDPQDLFDTNKTSQNFVTKLQQVSARNNSYDRYTFARLIEQLGTGSEPEVKGKININYVNDPSQNLIATNFAEWTPYQFFTNVAARLIRDNLVTNVIAGNTNFYLFNTNAANLVHAGFSVTNIRVYAQSNISYNEYTAPLHRLLQVAANIYDATTSNKFPTLYRPRFATRGNETIISDYVVETNSVFLASALTNAVQDRTNITNPDGLVWGIPVVVAAKKGFPSFNEFMLQTSVQVSRNLQLIKQTTNSPVTQTNQMLALGVSNVFGLEAWNSYIAPYTNRVRLIITNLLTMSLTNENGTIIWPANNQATNFGLSRSLTINNGWPSGVTTNSFLLPIATNFTFLSNSTYRVASDTFVPYTTNYEKGVGYPTPKWVLTMTNRLVYALVDASVTLGRVIDFVNLDKMTTTIDITDELLDDTVNSPIAEPSRLAGLWSTNRAGNATAQTVPTLGMVKQIAISMGHPMLEDNEWASYGSQENPTTKLKAIAEFTKFMGYTPNIAGYQNIPMPAALAWQTPFNPTRKLDQTISWQVNDPLVHYMTEDLVDSTNRVKIQLRVPPNGPIGIPNNLGKMNERYRPWGRRFGEQGVGPLMSGNATGEFNDYAYDFRVKDPRVRWSDDWEFPTNKFPNIGWLGRVHRGTPWQTVYLKSAAIANRISPADKRRTSVIGVNGKNWEDWSGRMESHPTNDWKLMDMFTISPNDNAARGLLSVNQTNQAAWSAVLSGVVALTNWQSDAQAKAGERIQGDTNAFRSVVIQPGNAISNIVKDINAVRVTRPNGVFNSLGDILAVPSLSVGYNDFNGAVDSAPFLNVTNYNFGGAGGTNKQIVATAGGKQKNEQQRFYGVNDEAYERLPQQIMSLLKLGEPQFVVYCYGQSLKPAPNSIVLNAPSGSGLFNLCTNYQITGEVVTRTVLHIEPNPDAQHPKAVIDSYNVLPAE